jgi:hypothetical protein
MMGVAHLLRATVSSKEVGRGKPAPDVYVEAIRATGASPLGEDALAAGRQCWVALAGPTAEAVKAPAANEALPSPRPLPTVRLTLTPGLSRWARFVDQRGVDGVLAKAAAKRQLLMLRSRHQWAPPGAPARSAGHS